MLITCLNNACATACRKLLQACTTTFICIVMVFMSASCTHDPHEKELDDITETIDGFATCYFNLDFEGSQRFCTEESGKWLSFISSNITQADIDAVRAGRHAATHETGDITITGDTTATATCSVSNFLRLDTLGKAGEIESHAEFEIAVVKRNGVWLVKMEDLPRSGKKSRD